MNRIFELTERMKADHGFDGAVFRTIAVRREGQWHNLFSSVTICDQHLFKRSVADWEAYSPSALTKNDPLVLTKSEPAWAAGFAARF